MNDNQPIDQHPGVQGLAQIGRNAIDRVIELEQARARDEIAFKQLLAQRDELLAALKFVIRGVPDTWEGVQRGRNAIARAEGEKS